MLKLLSGSLLIASLFFISPAQAFEIGAGGGVLTQGDDRLSPAIHAWLELGPVLFASSLMGEKNSAFSQQVSYSHLSYSTLLGKTKTVYASLGVGGMVARNRIDEIDITGASQQKTSASAGLALGLRWTPTLGRHLRFRMSWDSMFIPPGASALYLTYGHMQSVTTGLGWEF